MGASQHIPRLSMDECPGQKAGALIQITRTNVALTDLATLLTWRVFGDRRAWDVQLDLTIAGVSPCSLRPPRHHAGPPGSGPRREALRRFRE